MATTLKKTRIIDTYAALIQDGQGKAQQFFTAIEQYLKNANMPNVSFGREQVKTRRFFGGQGRDHIVVSHKSLPEFKMYISARDFGAYLDVTWAQTLEVGFMGSQVSKQITGSGVGLTYATLDLFAQQELSAYTTIVHRAVTETVQQLMEGMNQDFSKVNTRSRSGLAAW